MNSMYASQVLLCANTPPWVNTVCIVCVRVCVCLCCIVPPPGLVSTYWLKDFSCVFLTAESLLKTTGLRNLSVALRSRSARNSSALFCQTQRKCAFSLDKYSLLLMPHEYNRMHPTIHQEAEATVFLVLLWYLGKHNEKQIFRVLTYHSTSSNPEVTNCDNWLLKEETNSKPPDKKGEVG